jgi:hypothetical protein
VLVLDAPPHPALSPEGGEGSFFCYEKVVLPVVPTPWPNDVESW